jgi:hypothetical protein
MIADIPEIKTTHNIIPKVEKQADMMAAAVQAGKLLGERLTHGHDRVAATQRVRDKMLARFGETA